MDKTTIAKGERMPDTREQYDYEIGLCEKAMKRQDAIISRLKARINKLEQRAHKVIDGEWISVEDRLPEDGNEIYLVIRLGDISDIAHPYTPNEAMNLAFYSSGEWWDEGWPENAKEDNIIHGVTHYRPLPSPPKEQE